jgi:predicted N-acetyltransferase YhbS
MSCGVVDSTLSHPAAARAYPAVSYEIERPEHGAAVEALYDEVFGPGRFAKTAERLREGNTAIADACLVAFDDEGLVGAVRMWPIRVGASGEAALLGPLAVAERRRGNGVAFRLMEQAIAACQARGMAAVILVGDESYYQRAGFAKTRRGQFQLPGPVDPDRVLMLGLDPRAADLKGALSVPRAARRAS